MKRSRVALISGNWKMHDNHFEALKLIQELAALLRATPLRDDVEVSIHPPFTSLRTVQTAVESDHVPVALGAQTCHEHDRGAFTGEVSAEMLAKLNVAYVLAGHSERRRWCAETDEIVRAKTDAIVRNGMRPIVCVGETADERVLGEAIEVVRRQIVAALGRRAPEVVAASVVAYEPVWAIGTGETATATDAQTMCAAIRAEIRSFAGDGPADAIRIQYGGSVAPDNAAELLAGRDVDGLLVGGASLDASRFVAICRAAK